VTDQWNSVKVSIVGGGVEERETVSNHDFIITNLIAALICLLVLMNFVRFVFWIVAKVTGKNKKSGPDSN
jgi:hypothetical protein